MIDTAHQQKAHQAAYSAREKHRTDDDLLHLDADVFRSVLTLSHDRDLVALLAVIQVDVHKQGHNDGNDDA